MNCLTKRYQFSYANSPGMTVSVRARTEEEAISKAREAMDKRARKQDVEGPVAWTLTLVKVS